mgnify:FL=1|jgi:crotonobetainyl-CoA:carnitine CoA-transferase CaiB-like acyl-CoA transferase
MPGPLDGIKIVELSVAITGPLAAGILVDQGAECIKIERGPGGDILRHLGCKIQDISSSFQICNRGKRSVVLDLSRAEGLAITKDLITDADVVIQNYRPGVAERLGLAYSDVVAYNPEVIYADLSGFGPTGPHASRRVYDTAIQAASGLADNQTGLNDEKPVFLRQLIADKLTAHTMSQAITAALFARSRGTGGQRIELSMLDAAIAFLFVDGADHEILLDADHSGTQSMTAANTPIPLADGHVAVAVPDNTGFHGLADAFGVDSSDPDLANLSDRLKHQDKAREIRKQVMENAQTVTVEEATEALDARGVPFGIIRQVEEVADDPQVEANQTFVAHTHPTAGRVNQPRPPAVFHGTPVALREHSAPTLGQHTDEVVAETGRGDQINALREAGVIA